MRFVYIVECNDTTYYTGITKDLTRRIQEHNSSPVGAKYTKARRPVHLVWSKEVENRSEASKLEMEIKGMSRLAKKTMISL